MVIARDLGVRDSLLGQATILIDILYYKYKFLYKVFNTLILTKIHNPIGVSEKQQLINTDL